ncbi:MAG: hypothetical protein K6E73_10735 [Bacteroidales bacterium]|nr:hypothetical protein [Bacteroidales bacterium]
MNLYTKDGTVFVDADDATATIPTTCAVKTPAANNLLEWEGYRRVVTIEGEGTDGVAEQDGKTVWLHYSANGEIAATADETQE